MTLKTLADEYFEEAQRLRKRIYELRNLEEEATGQGIIIQEYSSIHRLMTA